MGKIRILDVGGSFYEMGLAHGNAHGDAIHHFTEDRIQLSMTDKWTGRTLSREAVLKLAEDCIPAHEAYSPQLMDELRGMSAATGLSLAALIVNNGFTDFIDTVYAVGDKTQATTPLLGPDDCTAFLVSNEATANGQGMYGQTWDMHDTATEHIILIHGKPDNAPNFLTFTIAGCVGMIGMNDAGIAVGINNIRSKDGQIGVTWNFVIRKILMQDNLDDALACITEANLAGAHNYMLMDKHGNGYNVERMASRYHIDPLKTHHLVHTNHCLYPANHEVERERAADSLLSSQNRLNRAQDLLEQRPITPETLMAVTRDPQAICVRSAPPYHVESCGAAIMRPASGDFWAVWGIPADNEYEHFKI